MLIESDSRWFITEAIALEKKITSKESKERTKGHILIDSTDYNEDRKRLVEIIGKINSVANQEGKGRDDLSSDILVTAEGLLRRIS
jgi:hypothetical protein